MTPPRRNWSQKFRDAFRGVWLGIRGQSSFVVHFVMAFLVLVVATLLQVDLYESCLLVLCVAMVLAAELFNSAVESLAKAIDAEHNEHLGKALDIASGAVLLCAVGAATVGATIFVHRLSIFLR